MTCQQALSEIMSNVEMMKVELQEHMQTEEKTAHDTAAMLCTAGDIVEIVDTSIAVLGARMSKAVSAETGSRCQLEQLLWNERVRVRGFGLALVDSNQTAREAVFECVELSAHLDKISEGKSVLEKQVRELACHIFFRIFSTK